MTTLTPFDPFDVPLSGTRLIEASAGTGKTYTIAGLFVRLLLEKGLTVDRILVVTYTKAATEELKSRIRDRIVQARSSFVSGRAPDDLLAGLLQRITDRRRAARLLGDALADFDRAAIFTIHGFCQRVLHENAFETGNLYDTELIADARDLRREIAEDFWRIHFYTAPPEWVSFAAHNGIRDPSFFERLSARVRFPEATVIPGLSQPELTALDQYRHRFRQLAARWPEASDEVLDLLRSAPLDGRTYGSLQTDRSAGTRESRLTMLAGEMNRYTGSPHPDFPPFNALDKFTDSGLQRAVRRGRQPPRHDLFRICDQLQRTAQELEAEMRQLMLYLKTEFFRWSTLEADRRKKARNIQHYDDLLLAVKNALAADAVGESPSLAKKTRNKYRAALVDEFQDTDAVQYEIFSTIFGSAGDLLFVIGDPKQSIYSFRGADIFSYMGAAADADSGYTLQENWRSEPGMITAVNTLFAGTRAPFLFEQITCEPVRPGQKPVQDAPPSHPALLLWYLPSKGAKPVTKTDAAAMIGAAVADEIAQLVGTATDPVAPADIAVLVRTNRQAQIVKQCLADRDIPAVLYSSGSVFATREAQELLQVLTGILTPGSESRFRAALATDMMGVSGAALARTDNRSLEWEGLRNRFQRYAARWKQSGFMRMFRTFTVNEKVRQRMLAYPDGERRLTNLLHLSEVLHRETDSRKLAPAGLLKWLVDRCRSDAVVDDEHQLRLESDEMAVKIVTIHKSKGLEYPIVFCPFGWEGSRHKADEPVIFHASEPGRRLTVDLGSDRLDAHRILAQHERLAENLRLLYVAVTRAKKKCYLVWGRIRTAETSAMAYLFHLPETTDAVDVVAAMKHRIGAMDDSDLLDDLHKLAKRSQGTISIERLPDRREKIHRSAPAAEKALRCPVFSGKIESDFKISSFSSMVSRRTQDVGLPDHDIDTRLPAPSPDEPVSPPQQAERAADGRTIIRFPRGARAGIFFHDLLEHLDFSPASETERAADIRAKLKQYGYEPGWQGAVRQAVDDLLHVRMPSGSEQVCLSNVSGADRVNEMEFYFPQKPVSPQQLGRIFSRHAGSVMPAGFRDRVQNLSFSPAGGFLMGYVDMMFRHGDRFYLLDWKSNYLGQRREDYSAARLAETMVSEHYILQYCLYTVAANRYLQLHWPDYTYSRHFGGVFYVFIRGVNAAEGADCGIYHDRPHPGLIQALDDALVER